MMKMLLLHPRTVFGSITALALVLLAAAPTWAASHPEAGGNAAGLAHPPRRLGILPNPLHVLAPWLFPATSSAEYPGALWEPASPSNYTVADRPLDLPIQRIVIHVAEGGFQSTYEWFKNPAARASANYVVGYNGEVAQMVHERDIAWHAGNWAYNETSIGIEHAGFTNHTWFPDAEYRGSARLAAHLADKYMIIPDRSHVIGHSQVPDPFHPGQWGGADHHTDPGRTWDWSRYMGYLRLDAHDTYQQIVDNTTPGGVRYSTRGWWTSSKRRYHEGPNYLVTTGRIAGYPITYRFNVPVTDSYDLFMRWPCNSLYSRKVTVGVATVSGYRSRTVDESRHCLRGWNRLGSYALTAGEGGRLVVLSRSGDGRIVAADAMRIVEARDPSPPTAPQTTVDATAGSLHVSWTASADNIAVGGYQLWVNGARIYVGPNRSADVAGVRCGTAYEVSVRAVDLAGNRSSKHVVWATTPECPTEPTNLAASGETQTSIHLSWSPGGSTVVGYKEYLNGTQVQTTVQPSHTYTGLACGTSYVLGVASYDAAGNVSNHASITDQTASC